MRGLFDKGIAQASGAAGKARDATLPWSKNTPGLCATGGDTVLDLALRSVTHSESAAVPKEALAEALRLAKENEESVATALRHVVNNVSAPAKEWRRINGALQLLEQLLRPSGGEALVGQIWFECKIQPRLKELKTFNYDEDRRVSTLVQRSATNVERAFKVQLQIAKSEDSFSCSTRMGTSTRGGSSVSSDASVTAERFWGANEPQIIGQPSISENGTRSVQRGVATTLDAVVCSDPTDSFMSRCCRCFSARETREPASPEERAGLTFGGLE